MKAAIEAYDTAIVLAPNDHTFLLDRAHTYRRVGNFDAALLDIARAEELAPNVPDASLERGWLLIEMDDATSAEAAFRAAWALDPERANAHYGLATAHAGLGQSQEALTSLERALALDLEANNAGAVVRALLRNGAMVSALKASRMINKAARTEN